MRKTPNALGRALSGSAVSVAVLIGLGVLASVAREVALARIFGTTAAIEFFRLAISIPYLLGTNLGSAITAAIAPTVTYQPNNDADSALALRRAILSSVPVALGVGVIGLLSSSVQVSWLAPGYTDGQRAELTWYVTQLWFFFILTAMTFGPRAYLAAQGITWPAASASLVLGAVMAVGTIMLVALPESYRTAEYLVLIALAAALTLVLSHFVATPRKSFRSLSRVLFAGGAGDDMRLGLSALGVVGAHLIGASPRFIDRAIATEFPAGTVAALEFSFAIITVPGLLFGSVLATSALPSFLAAWREQNRVRLQSLGLRAVGSAGLAAGCGLALALYAPMVVDVIFAGGAFDSSAAVVTSGLLLWHSLALGPMVASLILGQASLAAGLTQIYWLSAVTRLCTKVLAAMLLVPLFGLSGLAASFIVPEIASMTLLGGALFFRYRRFSRAAPP